MKREAKFPPVFTCSFLFPPKKFLSTMYHIPSEKSSTFRKIAKRIFLYSPFSASGAFFTKKRPPEGRPFPSLMESLCFMKSLCRVKVPLPKTHCIAQRLSFIQLFFFRCQSPLFLFFTRRMSLQISTNGITVNASATAMKYSFALMAANSKAVLTPGT